ncbi:MAG TPA: exodeoxyribonuclease VII small subunit [Geminicoccus sp.]|jgi:exodeoxyribonuclease VII small subunit|uniref:exodeoxyribonuclease VII small subunit n=1 Tax=Geminicoccus TaxID=489140 RepID=UPI00135A8C4A|nr:MULTISPECIES: exodeoxyribonuclease VII small subunit [Geminicoccus]HWL71179.1 exodeoxyribonuclease VII small subunit [Geminicoccus sp.]
MTGEHGPVADTSMQELSFEAALGELEKLVQELERGQLDLDEAISAYERGTALKELCRQKLADAQMRVEKLSVNASGEARVEPFDPTR